MKHIDWPLVGGAILGLTIGIMVAAAFIRTIDLLTMVAR